MKEIRESHGFPYRISWIRSVSTLSKIPKWHKESYIRWIILHQRYYPIQTSYVQNHWLH